MTAEKLTRVTPQSDGSLLVESPDAQTCYDIGNQRVFGTFDGCGGAHRVLLAEGYYAGAWRFRMSFDGTPVQFERATAVGRVWSLEGAQAGTTLQLTTFLEESTPVVFQRSLIRNRSPHLVRVTIGVHLDFTLPAGLPARLAALKAQHLPRVRGLHGTWGTGLAKRSLPQSARSVEVRTGGWVEATGDVSVFWSATCPPAAVERRGRGAAIRFEYVVPAGADVDLTWALSAGSAPEHTAALARQTRALADARAFASWLTSRVRAPDPMLQSLFVSGLNAAAAMFKELPGGFAGLVAGPEYAYPPRLYFRDGYWTAQVLLPFRPDLVRRHLVSLARGVHPNGQCPSAVFAPHLLDGWGDQGPGRLDWLPDHYDSPAFFVLLLADYLAATDDWPILEENVAHGTGRTIWRAAQAALEYLMTLDRDGDGLLEKPYAPNDWADNIRRSIWVTYDQALYTAALRAATSIAAVRRDDVAAAAYRRKADAAYDGLHRELWNGELGYFANYRRPGYVEAHFSIDTLVTVLFGLADPDQALRILGAARRLQTRVNVEQPFGDWGVASVFPLYHNRQDLFGKSAGQYHYHNGADWPYWDGVYGRILVERKDPEWRYVLTRWWEYGLARGWLTPVEYFSPPYPPGGMLQGWSSMPAAAVARLLTSG